MNKKTNIFLARDANPAPIIIPIIANDILIIFIIRPIFLSYPNLVEKEASIARKDRSVNFASQNFHALLAKE